MAIVKSEIHECDWGMCTQQFETKDGYLVSLSSYSGLGRSQGVMLNRHSGSLELCSKHFHELIDLLGMYR